MLAGCGKQAESPLTPPINKTDGPVEVVAEAEAPDPANYSFDPGPANTAPDTDEIVSSLMEHNPNLIKYSELPEATLEGGFLCVKERYGDPCASREIQVENAQQFELYVSPEVTAAKEFASYEIVSIMYNETNDQEVIVYGVTADGERVGNKVRFYSDRDFTIGHPHDDLQDPPKAYDIMMDQSIAWLGTRYYPEDLAIGYDGGFMLLAVEIDTVYDTDTEISVRKVGEQTWQTDSSSDWYANRLTMVPGEQYEVQIVFENRDDVPLATSLITTRLAEYLRINGEIQFVSPSREYSYPWAAEVTESTDATTVAWPAGGENDNDFRLVLADHSVQPGENMTVNFVVDVIDPGTNDPMVVELGSIFVSIWLESGNVYGNDNLMLGFTSDT